MSGVVGVDLSLRNTGMCFIPYPWRGTYEEVCYDEVSSKKKVSRNDGAAAQAEDDLRRRLLIAEDVCRFIECLPDRPTCSFVEEYAFSFSRKGRAGPGSSSVTKLAELGGVVKDRMWRQHNQLCVPVPSSRARKIVVGPLKIGSKKEQVAIKLATQGFVFPSMDIMDAFVVAYAGYCLTYSVGSMFQQGGE